MPSIKRLLLTCALAFASAGALANDCDVLLHRFEQLDPRLPGVLYDLKNINLSVVKGETVPGWRDFEFVAAIATNLGDIFTSMEAQGRLKEVQTAIGELGAAAQTDPIFQKLTEAPPDVVAGKQYLPTEYDLKRLYQAELATINKLLPPSLQLRYPTLAADRRVPELTAEAEQLIGERQKEKFAELFKKDKGVGPEEFMERLAAENPQVAEIVEALASDKVEISIRRPESGRWWVPKVGLQNQFVTGSSGGSLAPERRNGCEASALGHPLDGYRGKDAELKPKYGSFRPSPESGIRPTNQDTQYGSDIFILDAEKLKGRVTWTPLDSLRRYSYYGRELGRESYKEPANWQQVFIPLEYKALMAPYLLQKWASKQLGTGDTPPDAMLDKAYANGDYLETQIFGPLNLDHVKAFEFTNKPPSGPFLAELKRRGIEIRDGRSWPAKPWTE